MIESSGSPISDSVEHTTNQSIEKEETEARKSIEELHLSPGQERSVVICYRPEAVAEIPDTKVP